MTSGDVAAPPRAGVRLGVTSLLLGMTAGAWAAASFSVSNDHFGRISPARQIARYHELPFRDFFDPGYFLTELSSAFLQRLLGDNLLGEMLLTSAFIATGAVLVFRLAHRVTRSLPIAVAAAVLGLLAVPRPYDYDKVLFYPLGVLLACRYAERRNAGAAVALAAGAIAGALFRYDTGVYMMSAAVAALVAWHGRAWRPFTRDSLRLAGVAAGIALPVLAVVHWQVGLPDAIDQMWAYGTRERARTTIGRWPTVTLGPLAAMAPAAPGHRVAVRWAPSVDDTTREVTARRLGLAEGEPPVVPASRTWSYVVTDVSRESLRRIVTDPAVEDTGGIERGALTLSDPEPWWIRAGRTVPALRVRILPEFWQPATASAVIYYLCWGLPLVTLVMLGTRPAAARDAGTRAVLLSTVTVCLITDALILRDPVAARVGGMAGAPAVLAAWLFVHAWRAGAHRRPSAALVSRSLAAVLLGLAIWSLSVAGDWRHRVVPQLTAPSSLMDNVSVMAASPPPESQLPTGGLAGLVRYVRACTTEQDRVFTSWFVPELNVFAQRAFAGGMAVVFGGHWSEARFQQRAVARLASQSVPIAIVEQRGEDAFAAAYPLIDQYIRAEYTLAGTSDFGNSEVPGGYRLFVARSRPAAGTDEATGLPCFR